MDETTKVLETSISKEKISKLIRNHVYGSMGMGLIPIPALFKNYTVSVQA